MTSEQEREQFRNKPSLLNEPSFEPRLLTPQVPKNKISPKTGLNADSKGSIPAPKIGVIKRDKFNSTATMFMNTMIRAPDVNEILKCLALALTQAIDTAEKDIAKQVFNEVFSEAKSPLGDGQTNLKDLPALLDVHKFLSTIFEEQDLSAECAVMAFAYIDRLVTLTNVTLHPTNWRRIILGALILASKVWEDMAVWNVDFQTVFPAVSIQDLNKLERAYLMALQFTVTLKASVYAKYYFELRALSEVSEDSFPMKPLDRDGAVRLEKKSEGVEIEAKRFNMTGRSQSEAPYAPSANSISMEDFRKKKIDAPH
jgi:hypothetical protein